MKRQYKTAGRKARNRNVRAGKIAHEIPNPKIRRPAFDAVAYAAVLEVMG